MTRATYYWKQVSYAQFVIIRDQVHPSKIANDIYKTALLEAWITLFDIADAPETWAINIYEE